MVCRHAAGDPNCSSSKNYVDPYTSYKTEVVATPDSENYEVQEVAQVGNHLVLKVNYPNCKKCSYEGQKVMVYLNVTALQALKWKKLDPHFTDPKTIRKATEAPGPSARFPASDEGWKDALAYARSKQ